MESFVYRIKHRFPVFFRSIATLAENITALRFQRSTQNAIAQARLNGSINDTTAQISFLTEADTLALRSFLESLPEEHFEYFRPHRFDEQGLGSTLKSRAFMNYGLFVGEEQVGYALLKLSPTGSAYIGLLVHPDYSGRGLGTFLVHYLYWQAAMAGLKTRSTISQHNPASLKSHRAVADFKVIAHLPNDYMLVEFPGVIPSKPVLNH